MAQTMSLAQVLDALGLDHAAAHLDAAAQKAISRNDTPTALLDLLMREQLRYQVFNRRYQRASTIVTTNLAFKEWGRLFHNSAAASAIADRLVHKGLLIRIQGKSRRSDQEVGIE
jgi:hypothetical protein